MVPSPTSYDLSFGHNTSVTDYDDGQTDRQTKTVP